jgi:hypothetical protein
MLEGQLIMEPSQYVGDMDAVIADDEAQAKKKAKKKKGPNKDETFSAVLRAMRHDPFFVGEKFPHRFHVMIDEAGVRTCYEEYPNEVVRFVDNSRVIDTILHYAREINPGLGAGEMKHYEADNLFKIWRASAPVLDDKAVAPVRDLSEAGKCWHRLEWSLSDGETPHFDELFSRMDNAPAILAWLGSLFDPNSSKTQYVWLFGQGKNGKSSLGAFLQRAFGPSARSEQLLDKLDKFWTSHLVGKRLIIFDDCSDYKLPASGFFKSLTGSDTVRIERKGQASQMARLIGKFLFFSNDKPELSSTIADRRRAIYAEIADLPAEIKPLSPKKYNAVLWAEGKHFLWKAKKAWEEWQEDDYIIADTTKLDILISQNEENYETISEKYFDIGEDKKITPAHLREVLGANEKMNDFSIGKLKKWLTVNHNLRKVNIWGDGGKRQWVYHGISLKRQWQVELERMLSSSGAGDTF